MVRNRQRNVVVALAASGLAAAIAITLVVNLRRERAGAERRDERAFGADRANLPAPPIAVLLPDGRPLTVAQLRGKVVFVNFWATWCPPCRDEMPSMLELGRELSAKYPGRFQMLAISVDEGWKEVEAFFQGRLPRESLVALDTDLAATRAYYCGARGKCPNSFQFPESYVVDAAGRVVAYFVGPRDWSRPAARRILERIIAG